MNESRKLLVDVWSNKEINHTAIRGTKIKANVWGKLQEVILTTWEDIESLGFRLQQRAFGNLQNDQEALFFMATYDDDPKDNVWFVTTETLEDIHVKQSKLDAIRQFVYFTCNHPDMKEMFGEIWGKLDAEHFYKKLESYDYNFLRFYVELSKNNQDKFARWIVENYDGGFELRFRQSYESYIIQLVECQPSKVYQFKNPFEYDDMEFQSLMAYKSLELYLEFKDDCGAMYPVGTPAIMHQLVTHLRNEQSLIKF